MEKELEIRLKETVDSIRTIGIEDVDFDNMDPIAKMMMVALLYEGQKIRDYIANTPQRVVERYCTDFIPYEEVGAMPAIALLNPKLKGDNGIVTVGSGANFTFRNNKNKSTINYIPLFNTILVPYSDMFVLTSHKMRHKDGTYNIDIGVSNKVWVGVVVDQEIDSLQGLSFLIKGTSNISPERIHILSENKNIEDTDMEFSTMREMENIEMVEPFDAQQASGQFFAFINRWKERLLNMENTSLLYITDKKQDRDIFKPCSYPKFFQKWLENEFLEKFQEKTIWIQLDFPKSYSIPETFEIYINVLPVVNVDVNTVTLTQSTPIVKLQKQDKSFFLRVIETSTASNKQGYNKTSDDVIIRDFDASCYNNGDLYRDVRNLYNRFQDDYYAFVEYNGIKNGDVLKRLKEAINEVSKSVGNSNDKFKYDSGTYVMIRNIVHEAGFTNTKVKYMTTLGEIGNTPQVGDIMENSIGQGRVPGIELKVDVLVSAMGGSDKATVDYCHKLLRYYTLTNDRLYTRMDIDAFLRKEIMLTFGKAEYTRIFIHINVEGAGGVSSLQRGLYIDIEFKDKKNYEEAQQINFDVLMQQRITNLSCISMPIIVTLKNLEE